MKFSFIRFLNRNRDHCAIIVAILCSFILISSDQTPFISALKKPFNGITASLEGIMTWIPRLATLRRENIRLIEELGELSAMRNRYLEVMPENQRLRNLLGFKEQNTFDFIPAEIIGMGTMGIPGSIHINIGSNEACRKDMPIVTHKGIVGKLIAVNQFTSVGHLLADPNFRISGKDQRSRVLGIVRWLYGNICVLEGVPLRSDVQIGDLIVTSGYSRIYPAGLPIGRIFEVSTDKSPLFQKIMLRTEVDFSTLEEVLVIKLNSIPDE
jgi:rod shape-determining protein MreC